MWNKLAKINDISLTSKVICFIIFIITIYFIKNIYIIGTIILLLTTLTLIIKNKYIYIITLLSIGLFIINISNANMLIYLKTSLILNHLLLMIILIPKEDLKSIYYNVFYRPKDFKQVIIYLRELYYRDKYRNNMQELKEVANNMGLDKNNVYYQSLSEKVKDKTNKDINELIEINYIRFFNVPKKRGKLIKKEWIELDNTFLIIHILLLVLAIIYRS